MRSIVWIMPLIAVVMMNGGCQSAYRIKPESLPKKIVPEEIILLGQGAKEPYRLSDIYQQQKGLVVIFWQTKCPCVKRYQKRINRLFERYQKEEISFLHLSSNSNESFDEVQKEYNRRSIPLPLIRDEGGQLAKAIGAKGTPAAALINQDGNMVYFGWIDNERDEHETGRIAYLENAIIEFLNQKPITVTTSPMFGCPIH